MSFVKKRGQLDISFGMIFSIILIIIFLAFGFYGIKKFMDLQGSVQVEKFLDDFKNDVEKVYNSPGGDSPYIKSYSLPTKVIAVCFQDDEFENLKFTSKNIIRGKMIENIDISKTIGNQDSLCIPNVKGKVSLKIAKDYEETLVTITK
ncbi:MAG: hypothetical protein AABW47_04315 [Nanoarchaeota archaeon]